MNRLGRIALSFIFILFISVFGIYMIISPDRVVSTVENREMAQKPELTLDSVIKGSFMGGFEDYVTDQFPGRNTWLKSYLLYQRLLNQTFIYDYYITEDNWVFSKPSNKLFKDEVTLASNRLNELGQFLKEKEIELYYFSVPHKAIVLEYMLPAYISTKSDENLKEFLNNLDQTNENFVPVDMTDIFRNKFSKDQLETMYFKTDHHWNILGALESYKIIQQTMQEHSKHYPVDNLVIEDLELLCYEDSTKFDGSSNKQLYFMVDSEGENLCFVFDNAFSELEVFLNGKKEHPFDVYAKQYGKNNKELINYSDIFTYNHGEIKVINDKRRELQNKILVVKDSYANPLIYLFAQDYFETTFYDLRYIKDVTLYEYIEQNDFDAVAFVYNSKHIYGKNYIFN